MVTYKLNIKSNCYILITWNCFYFFIKLQLVEQGSFPGIFQSKNEYSNIPSTE